MELEGVCGVAVCYFGVEVGGEVDDGNSLEWASCVGVGTNAQDIRSKGDALLYADTTTNAQELRDECDLVGGLDLNTQLS